MSASESREIAPVDIVVRLVKEAATLGTYPEDAELFTEAADEIERLRADATDCPICPMLATDRDDALAELDAIKQVLRRIGARAAADADARWGLLWNDLPSSVRRWATEP